MDRNDQQAIEQLFGKLAAVEHQSPPRDAESETFISKQIAVQPGAPYYMAQTIIVQEQALEAAQARIEELEVQAAAPRRSGGLFGGLFGDNRQPQRSGSVPRIGRPGGATAAQPIPAASQAQRGGSGFLAGAAQTAMGVAGGILLGNAIAGMLGDSGEAQAAEADPAAEEPAADEAGFDDGGDFGDMEF
ncbi:DUF2076 domain-containing protein [Aquamicrobium sp. LC103]|uniref:DUF2076 domain-containing protein n=1 Tax=Aquamicrobium sp. LC103 TaxID=1120658 RepID=UPI00063E7962|nr:DUF2076 domain-containing protein [Aquamicrobium sp. LC103]TKT69860.1 DUF2076 domain-containing protein [Aquamicrobium sp. LC103]